MKRCKSVVGLTTTFLTSSKCNTRQSKTENKLLNSPAEISITVWYAGATAKDKGRLQRVIHSAERVIGCNLPSLQDLFAARTLKRARKIVADPSHPGHELFVPLPSGRRLRSIRTKTSRHTNSFFPSAVGLINRARAPPN
ncbi:uncharacterized protein ACO6RY_15736 [Pungitius sinensis]